METIQCTARLDLRPVGPAACEWPERVVFRAVSKYFLQLGSPSRLLSIDRYPVPMLANPPEIRVSLPGGFAFAYWFDRDVGLRLLGLQGWLASIRSPDRSTHRQLLLRDP